MLISEGKEETQTLAKTHLGMTSGKMEETEQLGNLLWIRRECPQTHLLKRSAAKYFCTNRFVFPLHAVLVHTGFSEMHITRGFKG